MRALLARRVDVAWLLLATALSGGLLVLLLALQAGSTPGGSVYIVHPAATTIAGHGGAPPGQSAIPTPTRSETVATAPTPAPGKARVTARATATTYPTAPTLLPGVLIDINTATAAELEALPEVGPVLAGRIVRDREANGPFATVDDLDRVKGIGPGIIAKVRDYVTVGP